MGFLWTKILITAASISLAGCSSLTQMQDSIAKFDQGAHSVSTAQMTFFRTVQAVDCQTQFYSSAYDYARGSGGIDLRGVCKPQVPTDAQVKIRQALMDAITLYADQIQALGTGDDDKNLDASAQDVAGKLNNFAKQGGLTNLSIAQEVEAAVIGLTNMVLDQKKADDIRVAASKEQDSLAKVVGALEAENTDLAKGMDSDVGTIRSKVATILADVRAPQKSGVFFDVIQAPGILRVASGLDASTDPDGAAQKLNAALDGLVTANHALATAGTGGIVAAITDLVGRAQAAQAVQGRPEQVTP